MRHAIVLLVILTALVAQSVQAQAPIPSPPAAPSNVHAGVVTDTSIEILWVDNATNESRVWLTWRASQVPGTPWQSVVMTGTNITRALLGNLTPDTTHWITVATCNGPLASDCSPSPQQLVVRTLPATTPVLPTETPTATPTAIPTDTPTATPTDTSTPTAIATSVPSPCPGTVAGIVIEQNVLTVTCVKVTETPWPDSLLLPTWRIQP